MHSSLNRIWSFKCLIFSWALINLKSFETCRLKPFCCIHIMISGIIRITFPTWSFQMLWLKDVSFISRYTHEKILQQLWGFSFNEFVLFFFPSLRGESWGKGNEKWNPFRHLDSPLYISFNTWAVDVSYPLSIKIRLSLRRQREIFRKLSRRS